VAPLVLSTLGTAAAEGDSSTPVQRILDLCLDFGTLGGTVHRPHPRVPGHPVARLQLPGSLDQPRQQGVEHALLDIESLDREAGLPAVEEAADRYRLRRLVQVGIVQND